MSRLSILVKYNRNAEFGRRQQKKREGRLIVCLNTVVCLSFGDILNGEVTNDQMSLHFERFHPKTDFRLSPTNSQTFHNNRQPVFYLLLG